MVGVTKRKCLQRVGENLVVYQGIDSIKSRVLFYQLMLRREGGTVLDVRHLPFGMYVIRVVAVGVPDRIKRVVISGR
jgi:hypothetical protein